MKTESKLRHLGGLYHYHTLHRPAQNQSGVFEMQSVLKKTHLYVLFQLGSLIIQIFRFRISQAILEFSF